MALRVSAHEISHSIRGVINYNSSCFGLCFFLSLLSPVLYSSPRYPCHNDYCVYTIISVSAFMSSSLGLMKLLTPQRVIRYVFPLLTTRRRVLFFALWPSLSLLFCLSHFHFHSSRFFLFSPSLPSEFRNLVIEMVLSTDMSSHFQQIKTMKSLLNHADLNVDKAKAMSLILHCCDISHPAKQFDIHHRWTSLLMEEFFRQVGSPFNYTRHRHSRHEQQQQQADRHLLSAQTFLIDSSKSEQIMQIHFNTSLQYPCK